MGDGEQKQIADWVHLPSGVLETNLWDCLHDASLENVQLDRLARGLVLQFDAWHIRTFHGLPDTLRFLFQFSGVKSLRILHGVPWPGGILIPDGTSREEASRIIAGYQAKAIEETVPLSEFEFKIASGEGRTEVFEAELAESNSGEVALKLFLHVNDDFYPEFFLRAETLSIETSLGEKMEVREFLAMGEAYWEDFARRAKRLRACEN